MRRSLIVLAGVVLMAGLLLAGGCAKKTPLNKDQKVYAGKWVAGDGTFIHIYYDGSADVETANTHIQGGAVTFSGGSVKVSLFGIKKEYKITRPPHGEDGEWTMELDGVTYKKSE